MLGSIALLLTTLVGVGLTADAQAAPHHFATFALFGPVTTSPDPETTSNFRLAIIQSTLKEVKGLDISGVVGIVTEDFKGIHATGIYSRIRGDATGLVATGVVSQIDGELRGVHLSAVSSYNQGEVKGLQFATVVNFTVAGFSGLQWSTGLNVNDGHGTGWQLGSIANVVNGHFVGLQTAAGYNFANAEMNGMQVGGLNWARRVEGAQVGLANLSHEVHGVQVGIVNLAEIHHGVPVGLVNVSRDGDVDWISTGSNFMGVSTGVRTTVRDWYSILSVGGLYIPNADLEYYSMAWHYGRRSHLSPSWSLHTDLGYLHLIPGPDASEGERLRPAIQLRASAEYRINASVAVHGGVGLTHEWEAYDQQAATETDPLFFGGISFFGGAQ